MWVMSQCRRLFISILIVSMRTLMVSLLGLTSSHVLFVDACKTALATASIFMSKTPCGSSGSFTCPESLCLDNYDGEGAESATCLMNNEICYDGACGAVSSSSVWKASVGLQVLQYGVEFKNGPLVGKVQFFFENTGPCEIRINGASCALCTMAQCLTGGNGIQADCTNVGQGILDECDGTNNGSPGDLLLLSKSLPYKCDATNIGSNTDQAPASPTISPPISPMTVSAPWDGSGPGALDPPVSSPISTGTASTPIGGTGSSTVQAPASRLTSSAPTHVFAITKTSFTLAILVLTALWAGCMK